MDTDIAADMQKHNETDLKIFKRMSGKEKKQTTCRALMQDEHKEGSIGRADEQVSVCVRERRREKSMLEIQWGVEDHIPAQLKKTAHAGRRANKDERAKEAEDGREWEGPERSPHACTLPYGNKRKGEEGRSGAVGAITKTARRLKQNEEREREAVAAAVGVRSSGWKMMEARKITYQRQDRAGDVGEGGRDEEKEAGAASETDCILTTHYGYY